jgi:hypothetical protein
MVKLPNWKEIKKTLDDPQKREELRENIQRTAERGRDEATKRLSGPAAHLRNVGSQFKSGLTEAEPAADAAPAPAPGNPPTATPPPPPPAQPDAPGSTTPA